MPEEGEVGQWESLTFLSALAAVTSRIQLGPMVAATSFRNPALTAKMADSIDEISNGRFIMGLGAGWHEPEYTAFGYPFDHLASRFEEALRIIVPLLRESKVDFAGEYYTASDAVLRPRGPSPKGPPILIGRATPTDAPAGGALCRRLEHRLAHEAGGGGRAPGGDAPGV